MLLQRLVEYSHRPDACFAPPMYSAEPVRYWIDLDRDGKYLGLLTVEDESGRPKRVDVPTLVRTAGVKAKLLADNAEYVLGLARPGGKPELVSERRRAFAALAHRCSETTTEPAVAAVVKFLDALDVASLMLPPDFDHSAVIGFRVDGHVPTDLLAVREFWELAAADGDEMQCLVCGRMRPAMERLQIRLKGIPGGQKAGLALISANKDAFTSYGLEASYVAPTCLGCSDRFMKAANHLIAAPDTHLRIGDSIYIFWTSEPHPFSFASLISRPQPDAVQSLLRSVFTARPQTLDPTRFYAAVLTASGARAVVRDWTDTTVGQVQGNLARFFRLGEVIGPWGELPTPRGLYVLAGATTRTGEKNGPTPGIPAAILRCALAGGPIPSSLLFRTIQRCRVENGVTAPRASLIKMVLLGRDTKRQEGNKQMVELDTGNREPSYLCGRLFAELEAVQRAALGDVGASIVDRYYGTASSAPATVFGRLLRGAQPHLGKLRRDKHGAYLALDARLQDILEGLDVFPTTLALEQQGVFALGYYHQRAADRQAARANRMPAIEPMLHQDNKGEE